MSNVTQRATGGDEWEDALLHFYRRYQFEIIQLDLLLFFYREADTPLTLKEVIQRTCWRKNEVALNLPKLVEAGLLNGDPLSGLYQRKREGDFKRHEIDHTIILRLAKESENEDRRSKIILNMLNRRLEG